MINKIQILYMVMVLLLLAGNSVAEENLPAVELSGFADVLWLVDSSSNDSEAFQLGQVELDFAASLDDRINLEMAMAYDPDAGSFGLGALVMDLALAGSGENHFHQSEIVDNAGLLIGQMDVPFGIDWMFYPSFDRQFITGPLVVSGTHDGWNDLGCALYLEKSIVNGIFYRLNGSGYAAPFMPEGYDEPEIGSAWGGRLGVSVLAGIEVGGSFTSIATQGGEQTSSLLGMDAQWTMGLFYAKGEYILQKVGLDSPDSLEHTGYYVEGMYHPGKYFLLVRYGNFSSDEISEIEESRLCLGAGYVVLEGAEIRLEQQFGMDGMPNQTLAQFVVGF